MATERIQGIVKWYDRSRGEGFLLRREGPDVHVPREALAESGQDYLLEGQVVEFEMFAVPGGFRARAVRVVAPDGGRGGGRPTG